MIIYPLPSEELDDVTLDKNIKAIAQVLANVHHAVDGLRITLKQIPLAPERIVKHGKGIELSWDNYTNWASTRSANYLKLVDMGLACIKEHCYRFERHAAIYGDEKYFEAVHWARDNVPQFPNYHYDNAEWPPEAALATPFPLCVPDEYKSERIYQSGEREITLEIDIAESYRNYYRAKLPKDAKWTRREKPEWI